jgi:hypothetical protein
MLHNLKNGYQKYRISFSRTDYRYLDHYLELKKIKGRIFSSNDRLGKKG